MSLKKRHKKVKIDYLSAIKKDVSHIEELKVKEDIAIRNLTTFKIGGNCRLFLEPLTYRALRQVKNYLDTNYINYYVLGAGSNILAPDKGVDCILSLRSLNLFSVERNTSLENNEIILRLGAGFSLKRLISWCIRNGFSGLESLVAIPASVGGAVRMNAGIKERSILDALTRILVLKNRELIWIDKDHFSPKYRDLGLRDNEIICACEFKLQKTDIKSLRDRLLKTINHRLETQPIGAKSAGCIFKNPEGDYAGRLIELCGLKGKQIGDAKVSEKHANFIINLGNAKQGEVLELINIIRSRVKDEFFKELSLEIKIWESRVGEY